jgi:hypothetical protein
MNFRLTILKQYAFTFSEILHSKGGEEMEYK